MTSSQGINIRFSMSVIILVLLAFLGGIFLGLAMRTRTLLHESILSQARSHFQSIVLTRNWNSRHGGVYVRKTEGMKSSPYLENPDIVTTDGQVYTLKNPALMTREISEMASLETGLLFHMTSLQPLNPDNMADLFEIDALQAFETGEQEVFHFTDLDGRPVFRYMAPLITVESCLGCHSKQGYQVGEVRGGISVTIQVADLQNKLQRNMVAIGIYGICVSLALIVTVSILVNRLVRLLNGARAEMEKLAVSDGLTGIYNRRRGMELMTIEIQKAQRLNQPLCCLLIDIDHFKQVNDNFGHASGDKVLKAVTAMLEKSLRKYDLLFRYGGEEFVVLFPGLALAEARGCAERIRQLCAGLEVPIASGEQVQLTLSGGLAELKDSDHSEEALIMRADAALYRAKDAGRNRIEEIA